MTLREYLESVLPLVKAKVEEIQKRMPIDIIATSHGAIW